MMCPITTRTFQLNPERRIGTIVIFVEGQVDEFKIFNRIFCEVLGYNVVNRRRGRTVFHNEAQFQSKYGRSAANVFIFNTQSPSIKSVLDFKYRDEIWRKVSEEYSIDLNDSPVYYIWDRDPRSNTNEQVKQVLQLFDSAMGDNKNPENGLALLSYPAVESYLISHFDAPEPEDSADIKAHVRQHRLVPQGITEETLLHAVEVMHTKMAELGIDDYDLDNFGMCNQKIFELEESYYETSQQYKLISLISIILLDRNIIQEIA